MKLRNFGVFIVTVFISVIALAISVSATEMPKYSSADNIDVSINGWAEADSSFYYVKDGAVLENQWMDLEGKTYYFLNDGKMAHDTDIEIKDRSGNATHSYRFDKNGAMVKSWFKDDENEYYYYGQDGKEYCRQWLKSDGKWYYFDYNGLMCYDEIVGIYNQKTDTSDYYCFNKDGSMVTGWYQLSSDDPYMYCGASGKASIGLVTIGNKNYFFSNDGNLYEDGIYYNDTKVCCCNADGVVTASADRVQNGWIKLGDRYLYSKNGTLVHNEWLDLGGYKYYIGSNKIMLANADQWFVDSNNKYYKFHFNKYGCMVKGWYNDGKSTSYYSDDGNYCCGKQVIDGKTYFFYNNGHLETNVNKVVDGILYAVDKKGEATVHQPSVKGWVQAGADWFYSDGEKFISNQMLNYCNNDYYFKDDCTMVADETNIRFSDGKRGTADKYGRIIKNAWSYDKHNSYLKHYSDSEGHYITEQLKEIDGSSYYFNYFGQAMTDIVDIGGPDEKDKRLFADDCKLIGKVKFHDGWNLMGRDYYYYENGKPATGLKQIGNATYYCFSDGSIPFYRTLHISGKLYCFDKYGRSVRSDWIKLYDDWYRTDSDGVCLKGWQKVGIYWYYFFDDACNDNISEDDESKMAENGCYSINNKKYCFDKDGRLITSDWCNWDNKTGRADSNGALLTGAQTINNKNYLFDDNGILQKYSRIDNDKIVVADENGVYLKTIETDSHTGWIKLGDVLSNQGYYYVYYKNGKQLIGWHEIGGITYYFNYLGKMIQNEEVRDENNNIYYINPNGSRSGTTGFINYNGDKCYLKNGIFQTGWQKIDNKWYYFDKTFYDCSINTVDKIGGTYYVFDKDGAEISTCSIKNGWLKVGDDWYYFKNGDILIDEYANIGGKFYYFNEWAIMETNTVHEFVIYGNNGELLKNQWIKIDGDWYYSNCDGRKYTESFKEINGKVYAFDRNGRML